ncbi:response regulator [Streptacidiphilus sp. PB12-B1b]|uniref:response regulator n=1 Tax=Streptacidiphilus sp. PB12-B1b TaxID=2705012 RepID=UPI0015FA1D29|nr:response regulator [Streptacidiphilus sp. PB12-B1b]QMU75391.1 response regulator [Streptacidiphilus sp. PB12-B1b]
MTRVLVVDDEPQMLRALRINLKARHYLVATAADGSSALRQAVRTPPEAVILDLGLPDLDGVDVIQALRVWSKVPIIVLSGRSGAAEKVAALDAGADDYVTKPFSMNELLARLRAVLRRPSPEEPPLAVELGGYTVDVVNCTVRRRADGPWQPGQERPEEPRLTPTEWRVLALLLAHPGRLVTGRQILDDVWGPGHESKTNYLRVYLAGLRRKLEPDPAHPRHLLTEPGMGYRYQP